MDYGSCVQKSLGFYLLQGVEDEIKENTLDTAGPILKSTPKTTKVVNEPQISIHAMAITPTPNTLRLFVLMGCV